VAQTAPELMVQISERRLGPNLPPWLAGAAMANAGADGPLTCTDSALACTNGALARAGCIVARLGMIAGCRAATARAAVTAATRVAAAAGAAAIAGTAAVTGATAIVAAPGTTAGTTAAGTGATGIVQIRRRQSLQLAGAVFDADLVITAGGGRFVRQFRAIHLIRLAVRGIRWRSQGRRSSCQYDGKRDRRYTARSRARVSSAVHGWNRVCCEQRTAPIT